jgi:oxygen-dependent protoporphyrinogen oxidase
MRSDNVLIVGGGLSGLSTAYYLARYGIRSTIIEKAGRLGGLIKTDQIDGCSLEAGPDSYLATKTSVAELADELGGLPDKIISSNDAARRVFVVRGGKLVTMPRGMSMMVPGDLRAAFESPLLGAATKVRLLRETRMKPRTRTEDFSVGELVTDHFGPEMLEYVAEPLLCGVYGGDAEQLSANSVLPRFTAYEKRFGSLIKGVKHDQKKPAETTGSLFRSFEGGMQTLTDALLKATAKNVPVIYSEVTRVEKAEGGWRVLVGQESISCSRVVMACPAHVSAALLERSVPQMAIELSHIPYSSAILAMLVFDRATLGHSLDGFGFLIPRHERKTIAAATWVNTKFPSRIRTGLAALRGFIVGGKAEELMRTGADKDAVTELVLADFQQLMGFSAAPLFSTIYFWPKCMPQYVVGHSSRVQNLRRLEGESAGIHLTSNIMDGVGVPDTIRRAKDVAKQIAGDRV